jgi:hypothetical protein
VAVRSTTGRPALDACARLSKGKVWLPRAAEPEREIWRTQLIDTLTRLAEEREKGLDGAAVGKTGHVYSTDAESRQRRTSTQAK